MSILSYVFRILRFESLKEKMNRKKRMIFRKGVLFLLRRYKMEMDKEDCIWRRKMGNNFVSDRYVYNTFCPALLKLVNVWFKKLYAGFDIHMGCLFALFLFTFLFLFFPIFSFLGSVSGGHFRKWHLWLWWKHQKSEGPVDALAVKNITHSLLHLLTTSNQEMLAHLKKTTIDLFFYQLLVHSKWKDRSKILTPLKWLFWH